MLLVPLVVPHFKFVENLLHLFVRTDEVCDSEVMGTFLLQEARSRYCHDTCLVYHFKTIQEVRRLALLLRFVNKLV